MIKRAVLIRRLPPRGRGNQGEGVETLPAGTRLFHGTLERFWGTPKPGGYDGVLWTAESPAVAQSYIPVSGGEIYASLGMLTRPTQDLTLRELQRRIGIVYDPAQVEWDAHRRLKSWPMLPSGRWPSEEEILSRLKRTGWMPADSTVRDGLRLRTSLGRLFKPDEKDTGRLYFGVAREPLRILNAAIAEEYQANDLGLFKAAKAAGFDGIRISDQLQSKVWGNVYHDAVGLFPVGIRRLRWRAMPATNYDPPDVRGTPPRWETTPEWEEARRRGRANRPLSTIQYHLTDRARFKLDPKHAPADNAVSIFDRSGRPGIYLAPNIEPWLNGHGYWRPFVAEFQVDPAVATDPGVHGRWGGELFVPAASFGRLTLLRVVPLDVIARETYGDYGWVEAALGRTFDTGSPIAPQRSRRAPFAGWRYTGPDVREMPGSMVRRLKADLQKVAKLKRAGRASRSTSDYYLAWLLLPPGGTDQIGPEVGKRVRDGIAHFMAESIYGASHRYVLYRGGHALAGLQVMARVNNPTQGRIANVWTTERERRRGHATALLRRAQEDFQTIEHSDDLSASGAAWARAVEARRGRAAKG